MKDMQEFADEVRRSCAAVAAARWYAMSLGLRCEDYGDMNAMIGSIKSTCGFVARSGTRRVLVCNQLTIEADSFSLNPSGGKLIVGVDSGVSEAMSLADAMDAIRGIYGEEVTQ